MKALNDTPFFLTQGSDIIAKVLAKNERGWSAASEASATGVEVKTEPSKMATPTNDDTTTNQARIKVAWSALADPDNGGSDITSYHLQWDNGSGGSTWVDLVGLSPTSTALSFTVSTGVVSGTSYKFRVRAANVYGWGSYSSTLTVKAAAAPAQVLSVSTTIDEATGRLKISWLPPSTNGDPITAYKVEIYDALLAVAYEESTYCPGTSTALLQNLYCTVPMTVLADSPYGYGVNRVIVVQISAQNSYGYGTSSTPNSSGARLRTVPATPSTPTVGSTATDTQVLIEWTALDFGDESGYVGITSYDLYSDNGSGDDDYDEISSSNTTSYLATGLTGGIVYKFKVRATNMYGSGPFSDVLEYTPQDVPGEVGIANVSISTPTSTSTTVLIDWDQPDEHSSTITQYEVAFLTSEGIYTTLDECPGTSDDELTYTNCTVNMSSIITATGLARDSVI